MAKFDSSSGQLQSPLVDDKVCHAALDAAMTGLAADEELAVGRQQRRFRRNFLRRVLVDLHYTSFSSSERSDVMENSIVDLLLELRQ